MRIAKALLITVSVFSLASCKDECPPCQEPRTVPINFGGKCVATRSDAACPSYIPPSPTENVLLPTALCQNSLNGGQLIGVWDSRPNAYGRWINEVRTIRRSDAVFSSSQSTIDLCPDLKPGRQFDERKAIDGPMRIRVLSWGYSAELEQYWVTGSIEDG